MLKHKNERSLSQEFAMVYSHIMDFVNIFFEVQENEQELGTKLSLFIFPRPDLVSNISAHDGFHKFIRQDLTGVGYGAPVIKT